MLVLRCLVVMLLREIISRWLLLRGALKILRQVRPYGCTASAVNCLLDGVYNLSIEVFRGPPHRNKLT